MRSLAGCPLSHLVLVALLFQDVSGQSCQLDRDITNCTSRQTLPTFDQGVSCLMKLNSLADIMSCVKIRLKITERICLDASDDDPDTDDEDYTFEEGTDDRFCFSPRVILIKGTLAESDAQDDSIRGALRSCPQGDPDYHNCLCSWNVSEEHLLHFARHFKRDSNQDLSCGLAKRRMQTPVEDADLDKVMGIPI